MESLNIDKNTLENLLRDLKPSKSPGPDGIYPRVLEELAAEVDIRAVISSNLLPGYPSGNTTGTRVPDRKRK